MIKLFFTFGISTLVIVSAFAESQKDVTVDGMVFPAHPLRGKWIGRRTAEVATPNKDGILTSEIKDLGDCPLEIVILNKVRLHKVDDLGRGLFDLKDNLIADGWVSQRLGPKEPRYFTRRLDKSGQTLLEPGGKVGTLDFSKDDLLAEYYSVAITIDHIGTGRTSNTAPKFPFLLLPSQENAVLSRYDQDSKGNLAAVPYYVQENLIGYQGEGETKGEGVPEKPFFKVELKFNPATQEPMYLDYTAGVVTGKNKNDWYFADTFNYECRGFKKAANKLH